MRKPGIEPKLLVHALTLFHLLPIRRQDLHDVGSAYSKSFLRIICGLLLFFQIGRLVRAGECERTTSEAAVAQLKPASALAAITRRAFACTCHQHSPSQTTAMASGGAAVASSVLRAQMQPQRHASTYETRACSPPRPVPAAAAAASTTAISQFNVFSSRSPSETIQTMTEISVVDVSLWRHTRTGNLRLLLWSGNQDH